jgi:NTE family protein
MSLDTIIHSGLDRTPRATVALVLMGGGARTAYQVGVLRALAGMLRMQPQPPRHFPFQVLVGTSAGAINATCLAAYATQGLNAFDQLADFWGALRSSAVYQLTMPPWARLHKVMAAYCLSRHARTHGAILDNTPLVNTLHHAIALGGIESALKSNAIDALAITASSYSSGVHWTFCHTAHDSPGQGWSRPGRRAEFQPITIEHLIASSAIPFLFPSTPLWVDGHAESFGDGSMRQVSPLSPALHLGAKKIMVIGVGQPQRSGFAAHAGEHSGRPPTLGGIAGHAMASVFHDTLQADVEQTQRVTNTLKNLPLDLAAALPYRSVNVLAIQPTESLDAMAHRHVGELPAATRNALGGLGILKGGGGALASYLLFEPGFVQTLIAMGESDAYARKTELMTFFASD